MSRSAMPWRVRAAITWVIRAAFWRMASTAVGAWVMTPRLIVAMSGATRVSP